MFEAVGLIFQQQRETLLPSFWNLAKERGGFRVPHPSENGRLKQKVQHVAVPRT